MRRVRLGAAAEGEDKAGEDERGGQGRALTSRSVRAERGMANSFASFNPGNVCARGTVPFSANAEPDGHRVAPVEAFRLPDARLEGDDVEAVFGEE